MSHFAQTFASHGYIAIFALMLLESACIPIPSEVTMLYGGYLASGKALGAHPLNIAAVIAAGVLGNLIGSLLAYGVGRSGGRALLMRYGKYILIKKHDIEKGEAWFARRGEAAVFFGRLLPVVRTFISLPAGVAEMPIGKFSLYTTIATVPWVAALTYAGYALGRNWHRIVGSFSIASIIIAVIAVVAIALWMFKRRRTQTEVAS
ncbi:MAG: DedA family protein [Actinomycetota bacterium]